MEYRPEGYSQLTEHLEKETLPSRERLAELLSFIVGVEESDKGTIRPRVYSTLTRVSPERRGEYLEELRSIADEAGWKNAKETLASEMVVKREIKIVSGLTSEVETSPYRIKLRRPEEIETAQDIVGRGEVVSYWIPVKTDIKRYVKAATLAHERARRQGSIKIIDIGGGSGFVSKLIADEAREQGLDLQVVVIDPKKNLMEEASRVYADTSNLQFETGDALEALRNHGPKLSDEMKEKFDGLEAGRQRLINDGREELSQVQALLMSLESANSVEEIIDGPFGSRARGILSDAGLHETNDLNETIGAVCDHYRSLYDELTNQIVKIRNEQEAIFSSVGPEDGGADMVINSWMPLGLDFTREIRWISAPVIAYSLDAIGGCGYEAYDEKPADLGKEQSFDTGDLYDNRFGIRNCSKNEQGANYMDFQVRKDVPMYNRELSSISIRSSERYRWEKTIKSFFKHIFGRSEADNKKIKN